MIGKFIFMGARIHGPKVFYQWALLPKDTMIVPDTEVDVSDILEFEKNFCSYTPGAVFELEYSEDGRRSVTFVSKNMMYKVFVGRTGSKEQSISWISLDRVAKAEAASEKDTKEKLKKDELEEILNPIREVYKSSSYRGRSILLGLIIEIITRR